MYPVDPNESPLSSSSDDSENEVTEISQSEISALSKQVDANPYLYDVHIQIISILRKAGELDRLREARERMSKYFPLSPDMWLQWTKDEASVLTHAEDREPIYKLFQRALADYQNVDVWLEYCQFAIGGMEKGQIGQLSRIRSILEEAVANQGLNFGQGAVLFEVYREFEAICLARLQSETPSDDEAIGNQLKKIDSIFKRQLSIPHVDLAETMAEYRAFLEGLEGGLIKQINDSGEAEISADCDNAYTTAVAKWNAVEPYESAVSDARGEEKALLSAWESYLTWAVDKTPRKSNRANVDKLSSSLVDITFTPHEIICLYERAITDVCLQPSIWLQMADYLEIFVTADQKRLVETLARSVRNITWSSHLWCRYAFACELQVVGSIPVSVSGDSSTESHFSKEFEVVKEVFETALQCVYPSADGLRDVWIAYCDFTLRRLCETAKPEHESINLLRTTFERAYNHVCSVFSDQGDPECLIYRYWAFVEAKFLADKEKARSLWTELMKTGRNGSKPALWIAYLNFERDYGTPDHIRRVAGMAVNSVIGQYVETVFQTARRCLIESGANVLHLREFDIKVAQRKAYLAKRIISKTAEKDDDNAYRTRKRLDGSTAIRAEMTTENAVTLGKRRSELASESPSKGGTKRLKKDTDAVSRVDVGSGEKPMYPRHGQSVTHDPSKDDRTVFVSNLPFTTREDELATIFQQCGQVTSVRLVRDYAGKSKGFGYVEFVDASCVPGALKMDRHPVEVPGMAVGRPLYVSVCDTNRSSTAKAFAYTNNGPEPKKLFVRNLDKQVREEALRTFFGKHGEVTGVRVVTFRNGMPKGHAYVEFASEEDASRALVATDGVVFGSAPISVAISNPPPRGAGNFSDLTGTSSSPASSFTASRAPAYSAVRTHAHSQLSFMPRALHRVPPNSASTADDVPQQSATAIAREPVVAKSNEDFRKMFLNK